MVAYANVSGTYVHAYTRTHARTLAGADGSTFTGSTGSTLSASQNGTASGQGASLSWAMPGTSTASISTGTAQGKCRRHSIRLFEAMESARG